jgi:sec-independent protein translocase protein TatC
VCAVVAALTTPADVFSMLIMLVPLYMLYELGILLATWLPASRMRGRQSDADAEA